MLLKCCSQYVSKSGKLSSGCRTGKSQFSFQSQRKAMPKNVQTMTQKYQTITFLFPFHQEALFSSSLYAIRVVSSAYLRLLIFLLAILIPACASSSLAFRMMYSAYKLNKQGDNIQPWCTPFPIWNQSFSHVQFFATPWTAVPRASLSFTISHSLLKIYVHWYDDVIQPSHPLSPPFLWPSVFPSTRFISSELTLHIRWPKYWRIIPLFYTNSILHLFHLCVFEIDLYQ